MQRLECHGSKGVIRGTVGHCLSVCGLGETKAIRLIKLFLLSCFVAMWLRDGS